jgi:hypothetical protein
MNDCEQMQIPPSEREGLVVSAEATSECHPFQRQHELVQPQ